MQRESSTALAQGLRLGFLGTLHMDVFRQRLEDEYDANILITAPTVPFQGLCSTLRSFPSSNENYIVVYRDGRIATISNPTDFPEVNDPTSKVKEVQEPIVNASIIIPEGKSTLFSSNYLT